MDMQKIFDRVTPFAVLFLIVAAFYVASRSFWGVDLQRFEIVILTTGAFGSCAWLLSSVLPTAIELIKNRFLATAGVVSVLGLFLLTLEVTLTKIGFGWLQNQGVVDDVVFNDTVITVISVGLSMFNIFAKWSFVTAMANLEEIKQERKAAAAREERRSVRLKNAIAREKSGLPTKKDKRRAA